MGTIIATFIYLATITFAPTSDVNPASQSDIPTTEASIVGGDIQGL